MELACPDRRDRDQAAGRGLLVQHSGPALVGPVVLFDRQDLLDKVLAQRHVVEPAIFLQGQ